MKICRHVQQRVLNTILMHYCVIQTIEICFFFLVIIQFLLIQNSCENMQFWFEWIEWLARFIIMFDHSINF